MNLLVYIDMYIFMNVPYFSLETTVESFLGLYIMPSQAAA